MRRIFRAFADGKSPRQIAADLNADKIPSPKGATWSDTSIRGQVARGTGILNTELYDGRLVWNHCTFVRSPETGKRLARVNPESEWVIHKVPHLRIVDQELWDRVKRRQAEVRIEMSRDENGNALNRAHRRKFLLSGLLVCGCCGAGYTITGKDRYGCAAHRAKGETVCANGRVIARAEIEHRVIDGLRRRLVEPRFLEVFIAEYQAELNRAAAEASGASAEQRRELAEVERKIDGMHKAIEDGLYTPAMKGRMTELGRRKMELDRLLAATPATPVRVHPGIAQLYRAEIDRLTAALGDGDERALAADVLRSLIDKVVLAPQHDGDGLDAELSGPLAAILGLCEAASGVNAGGAGRKAKRPSRGLEGRLLSVVAGRGNHLCRTQISWTSRV